jgi:hypothetical protein
MPRILAIDWDRREIRGVLISSGATGTSVSGAWAASLETSEAAGLSGKQIGNRLATEMGDAVSGKVTTLVGVGRDNVQIKLLTLPPAPPEELPEMVRFQAEREFTALGGDAALDFIPLAGSAETAHQVLALALNAAGMAEATDVCEAIGVTPDRIPVRGCAAAAMVHRAGLTEGEEIVLAVNLLFDEADLAAMVGDAVVLLRTVRLADADQFEGRQKALVGEIRRTMAAVRQQMADHQVSRVVVCGAAPLSESIGTFTDEIGVAVAEFNPAEHAPAGLGSTSVSAESLGRFSAVLGMALSEADRHPPIVDFANVRKRVEARRFTRVHLQLAAVAALLAAWGGFYVWQAFARPARELTDVQKRIQDVQQENQMFKDVTEQAEAVDRWLATDVNWLDELSDFAQRVRPQPLASKDFPVADDAVINQLTLGIPPGNNAVGGRMEIQAVAKSPAAVAKLEERLRGGKRTVSTGIGKLDKNVPGYDWSFGLDVRVSPEKEVPAEATKK